MAEYKRRIELFSLYDHTNIEKHLEKMAAKGWMIDTIGSTFWRYKKIEPKKLKFSVVYYPKDVKEGVIISDDRQNFIDLCSSGGWNYVINSGKMHIFSTDDENAPPIDTDAPIQIECIHKFAKAEIIYGYLFLIALHIFLLISGGYRLWKEPVETLTDTGYYSFYYWLAPTFFIFSVYNIISYLTWYKKAKAAAENGEFTDTKKLIRFEFMLCYPIYSAIALLGIFSFMRIRYILFVLGLVLTGIVFYKVYKAVKKSVNQSERKSHSKQKLNRFVAVILVFVWIGAGIGAYIAIPKPYYKIKENKGYMFPVTHRVYLDKDAPLDINDFKDTNGKTISRENSINESILIKETDWRMYSIEEDDDLSISYTITNVRFAPIFNRCKEELIDNNEIFDYEELKINSADSELCEFYIDSDSDAKNYYAFCNDKRIVSIGFGWEPSEEELIFAAERLLNSQNTYSF